jgi:hypothetical protein
VPRCSRERGAGCVHRSGHPARELADPAYIDRLPLDVDWDAYRALDQAGKLLLVVARVAGEIVGYTITIVHQHLHYRQVLVGHVDTYWLHPAFRMPDGDSLDTLTSTGAGLLIETEDTAAKMGAQKMVLHTRFWADNQRLFELLGFTEVERLSTKWIGK